MAQTPTFFMLLWHQHQPFYKDLVAGRYEMPWVRLHALKDYYGMVAMLREFPSVHVTFNLVPSLVAQLEDYAEDRAEEDAYELAFKPAAELTAEERVRLLDYSFQVNRENLLYRYPRFRQLYEKARPWEKGPALAPLFTVQELLDLQVVSQLAWFDETYLEHDPVISGLVSRQRNYTEQEKPLLRAKEIELVRRVLDEHRQAEECGQIEISTSPFYHPILPLLCDSNVAAESHPGIRLPQRRFQHPEDAREQLRSAVELHERVFGRRPRGLWPSEGSVSEEALALAAEQGFVWAATDEEVLGRSLGAGFNREPGGALYRPYRHNLGNREIALFFRDHQISDRIGFVYSRMDPEAAADDLHARIRAAGGGGGRAAVVSVILDGENAWEYYPRNGRQFLRSFYARVAADPDLRAVTPSEALSLVEPTPIGHVVPGSWINANFDVWIGADEDNRAWDLLSDARDFFDQPASRAGDPAQVAQARQELDVAEGSDWCWWYGPEHSTANDERFDLLYRQHLSNVYRLLGASPPDALAVPIKRPRSQALIVSPTGTIAPAIDGRLTNYFEWLGAGLCAPAHRAGAMHGTIAGLEVMYYGYDERSFYLRLDFVKVFLQEHRQFEVRMNSNEDEARLQVVVRNGEKPTFDLWRGGAPVEGEAKAQQAEVAFDRVLEIRLDRAVFGAGPRERVQLQVSLWVDELPLEIIPEHGWLELELGKELVSW